MDEEERLRAIVTLMRQLGVDEYSNNGLRVKLGPPPTRLQRLEERAAQADEPMERANVLDDLKAERARALYLEERQKMQDLLASTPYAGNETLINELVSPDLKVDT